MKIALTIILTAMLLTVASGISITTESAFELSEAVIEIRVIAVEDFQPLDNTYQICRAKIAVFKVLKSKEQIPNELYIYYETPKKDSSGFPGVGRCPPFVELKPDTLVTIGMSRCDIGKLKGVWVVPSGDYVQNQKKQ